MGSVQSKTTSVSVNIAKTLTSAVVLIAAACADDRPNIVFMSDNGSGGAGGRGRRQGLSGGKGSVWEGGIRSPLIIRGPGANSWCHERVVGYDFFPTFCQWAGIPVSELPARMEGSSIAGLLATGAGTVSRPREELEFHFPHYQSEDGPPSALFLGKHKLIEFYEDQQLDRT